MGTGLTSFVDFKRYCRSKGGRMWAENNADGKGRATFYFSLPLNS